MLDVVYTCNEDFISSSCDERSMCIKENLRSINIVKTRDVNVYEANGRTHIHGRWAELAIFLNVYRISCL